MANPHETNSLSNEKIKSVVLLSGGLDSTVNLFEAMHSLDVVQVLTFDYGQRAAQAEIRVSQKLCRLHKLNHEVIALPFLKKLGSSSLTKDSVDVPLHVALDSNSETQASALKVWVPNRNGIFLNIAAAYAESLDAKFIVPGFNLEEAETFPDNSEAFCEAVDQSLSFSTQNKVTVHCFTAGLVKSQIVKRAKELNVPLHEVWPCYFTGDKPCGQCESCQRFLRALG